MMMKRRAGDAEAGAESAAGARRTVLVVEDEVLIRMDAAESLRAAGYDVVEAASADEALSMLENGRRIDLVFSDIRMPGEMDGLALAAEVRRRAPAVEVILTSGHLMREDIPAGSATSFVPKPYALGVLLAAIAAQFGQD